MRLIIYDGKSTVYYCIFFLGLIIGVISFHYLLHNTIFAWATIDICRVLFTKTSLLYRLGIDYLN